jgi:hypothetical protein
MTDASPQSLPSPQDDTEADDGTSPFPIARLLWVVAALAFLGYVVFGSVSARIWRFNRLYFEDRRILEIWRYEGRNLPDVPLQDAVTVLYYGAVVALILATVLGLRYLLDDTGFRPQSRATSSERHPAAHE